MVYGFWFDIFIQSIVNIAIRSKNLMIKAVYENRSFKDSLRCSRIHIEYLLQFLRVYNLKQMSERVNLRQSECLSFFFTKIILQCFLDVLSMKYV